jgi:hypothetical protein
MALSRVVTAATTPGTSPESTAPRNNASLLGFNVLTGWLVAQPAAAPASNVAPVLMNVLRSYPMRFSS